MSRRACTFALLALSAAGLSRSQDLTEKYKAAADKLIDAALADNEGYKRLAYLCYRIGNRLSGSESLRARHRLVGRADEGRRA